MELRDKKEMSIKELVERQTDALGTLQSKKLKGQKIACFVWNQICGEIGRKHTMGLFLEESKQKTGQTTPASKENNLPILHVYLDSHALIQDFSTDLPVYQAKMAQAGLPVKKIVFQLSKKAGQTSRVNVEEHQLSATNTRSNTPPINPQEEKIPLSELPQLTPEDAKKIQKTIKHLPPELQKTAVSAMSSSMRRENYRKNQKNPA